MKKLGLISILISIVFISCNTTSTESTTTKSDTLKVSVDSVGLTSSTIILNDLFLAKSETELKEIFGDKNVIRDTIWGPELSYELGTFLFRNTDNEVEITWQDSINYSNMVSVSIRLHYDENYQVKPANAKWKTVEGIQLGMTLKQLVEINGKPVSFYGIGWDYGGGVSDYNGGKLEKSNLGIALNNEMSDSEEYKQIENYLGDTEFKADKPEVINLPLTIYQISIYN